MAKHQTANTHTSEHTFAVARPHKGGVYVEGPGLHQCQAVGRKLKGQAVDSHQKTITALGMKGQSR